MKSHEKAHSCTHLVPMICSAIIVTKKIAIYRQRAFTLHSIGKTLSYSYNTYKNHFLQNLLKNFLMS